MFFYGFTDELLKLAAAEEPEEEKPKKKGFIRKAGPGLGALAGLAGAFALKKPVLTGVGTGATIGWVPDITASLVEAVREKKEEIEKEKKK